MLNYDLPRLWKASYFILTIHFIVTIIDGLIVLCFIPASALFFTSLAI